MNWLAPILALALTIWTSPTTPPVDPCGCGLFAAPCVDCTPPVGETQACSFTGTVDFQVENGHAGHCVQSDCIGPPSNCTGKVTTTVSGVSDCWIVIVHEGGVIGRGLLNGAPLPPQVSFSATYKLDMHCESSDAVNVKFGGANGACIAWKSYECRNSWFWWSVIEGRLSPCRPKL